MKQRMRVIEVLVVLTALGGTVASAQQPIVISTFDESNPIIEIAEKVMTEAYQRIGLRLEIRRFPGERSIRTANYGKVDGELFRKEGIKQTYPNLLRVPVNIVTGNFMVFTKNNTFPVEGWKSLIPYSVGYMRGVKAIEMNLVEGTRSEAVTRWEQAFKKLDAGRNDVVVATRLVGLETLNKLGLKDIIILEPPLLSVQSFHYLHVKNQRLAEPLTEALQQMKQEGIIRQIQQQVEQSLLKPYKVCLTYLPGFINSKDEGIGARLNKKILSRIEQREGVTFEVSFYPSKRALMLFNNGEADIVFATILGDSGSDQTISQNYDTIDSAPLAGSGYAIFTLKSFPKLSKPDELRGKHVGIIRGITLPEDFANISTKSVENVNSMEQNIFMLQQGRINAILTLKSLGMEEIRRLNITDIHCGKEFDFRFACYSVHLTREGSQLVEYINHAVGEIFKDGTYQTMMQKYPEQSLLK